MAASAGEEAGASAQDLYQALRWRKGLALSLQTPPEE